MSPEKTKMDKHPSPQNCSLNPTSAQSSIAPLQKSVLMANHKHSPSFMSQTSITCHNPFKQGCVMESNGRTRNNAVMGQSLTAYGVREFHSSSDNQSGSRNRITGTSTMKTIKKKAREILTSSFLVSSGLPTTNAHQSFHTKSSKVMERVRARIDKQFNNNSTSRLSETILNVAHKESRNSPTQKHQ